MRFFFASSRSLWIALAFLPFAAIRCAPDERRLQALVHSDLVAGSGPAAGAAGADSESVAGDGGDRGSDAGQPGVAGQGGIAGGAVAGAAGFGGALIVDPGGSGTVNGGGAAGSSGTGGALGAGGGATAGRAGSGGATVDTPCGDIDHDGVDDCTETLLLNSRLDTDATQWLAGANAIQAWDVRDARGKSGSGSILVTNQVPVAAVDARVMAGTEQCIAVTEGAKYEMAARVMIPDGQGVGEAGLNLYVFTGDACSGIFVSGITPGVTAQTGAWVVVDAQVEMPVGARSVVVRLVTSKPFTQDKLSALFDDVLVRALH